ncbi:fimbrial biogenesis outer membrane usher protein [Burkholderia sp. Se-20373]|uniref:fimbria/pilus outer membrane usher protein n=1 Tax=Burkholderia sp. Se-20373 TaxID=2703898 RepID=UPI00197E12AA|nr:fimbria/pilus outer membrane usher protein [Burkholderia sp. Se-20373]MBN3747063.1 fimbrial biogenesis outer membrane usher protein [Burkholderia sp. Se-20373]
MTRCLDPLRRCVLALASTFAIGLPTAGAHAHAHANTAFNPAFLAFGNPQADVDLDVFAEANVLLPGVHPVDVSVNGEASGMHDIRFERDPRDEQGNAVRPCLGAAQLDGFGVNLAAYPRITEVDAADAAGATLACVDPRDAMPDATVTVDPDRQTLALTVPQAKMKRVPRGSVDPSRWDEGINALRFDYRFNAAQRRYDGPSGHATEAYGSVRAGLNLGAWRLRSSAMVNHNASGLQTQFMNTYLERDLPGWRSRVTFGENFTSDNVFDSVAFRGVQLASDDTMQPDSQRGYAPVVRGIAQSHAKVEIRQNGYLIYSSYVPPGPFEIDDLYAIAAHADLEVTIVEADGQKRSFIQPSASIPTLLRQNAWSYRAAAGRLRTDSAQSQWFTSASAAYGLPGETTIYGGVTFANGYAALAAGAARNLARIGALSVDVTHARYRDQAGQAGAGSAVRAMYAKAFASTGTELRAAHHQYSGGYRSLSDVVVRYATSVDTWAGRAGKRNRSELSVSQSLGGAGSLYVSASRRAYRDGAGEDRLLQLGYSGSVSRVSYNVSLSAEQRARGERSRQVSLNLSIPFGGGRTTTPHAYGSATLIAGTAGTEQRAGVFGTLFDDDRLSYGVDADRTAHGLGGAVNLNYRATAGQFGATHNQTRSGSQTSVSAAGGMVVHGGGVTLSQPLGETVALVRSEGAADVGVIAHAGVRTDRAGNAVVPNVTPYRQNRIALRTAELDRQLEIRNAIVHVVPTRGAVVLAPFEVEAGRLMLDMTDDSGQPVPFGAAVLTAAGKEVGMVGPGGQGFVTGVGRAGDLFVRWGPRPDERCALSYNMGESTPHSNFPELEVVCSRTHPALRADAASPTSPRS